MEDAQGWHDELLEAAKLELRQRENRIAQLERQLELAQAELVSLRDRAGILEQTSGELEEQASSLHLQVEEMREALARYRRDEGQSQRKVIAATKLDEWQRGEIARLEGENRTLVATNDEQARRIRALDQIIDGYAASNARIRSDYEKLRQQMQRRGG